jgi:hypothetical protein
MLIGIMTPHGIYSHVRPCLYPSKSSVLRWWQEEGRAYAGPSTPPFRTIIMTNWHEALTLTCSAHSLFFLKHSCERQQPKTLDISARELVVVANLDDSTDATARVSNVYSTPTRS